MDTSDLVYSYKISFFFLSNLLFSLISLVLLFNIYKNYRHLLVKPSTWLIVYTHLFFQWPLVLFSNACERWLPNPYTLSLLVNGFVVVGIALSYATFGVTASDVYSRLLALDTKKDAFLYNANIIFGLLVIGIILYVYLSIVPFASTGFYAIFFDPISYSTAREASLKLLEGASIRYLYSIMFSTIAPMTVGFLVDRFYGSGRKLIYGGLALLLVIVIGMVISITGERTGFLNLLIVGAFVFLMRKDFLLSRKSIAVIPVLALAPPLLISLIREEKASEINWTLMFEYAQYILNRALVLPFQVGTWFVHYKQVNGPIGIAAIQKLADVLGVASINGPNLIGLTYGPQYYGGPVLETISATSGYLFSTYCYLGIVSLPMMIFGAWVLDLSLYAYRILDDVVLVPCMACINLSTLMFIQSDYTVVLLTHGFLMILIFSVMLSRINGYLRNWRLASPASPSGPVIR